MQKNIKIDLASLFTEAKISAKIKVGIVIPVKNEEIYIYDTLSDLANQVDQERNKMDNIIFEILMLANNCSDHNVQIIQKFKKDNVNINIHFEEITLQKE